MIPLETFLRCVRENAERIHGYELGHDGSDGESDCIGLIIGALGLAGFRWPGTHGSNWAARNAMSTLEYIEMPVDVFLGEIVYKAREPGESGYDLPSSYANSPDKRDYYHVGVVTSVDPLIITHCTSVNGDGGIFQDEKIGKWHWGGKLKYVDYSGEEPAFEPFPAVVFARSGKTVHLRKTPSKSAKILYSVKIGETVSVIGEYDKDWSKVEYKGIQGYMMNDFLVSGGQDENDPVTVDRAKLRELQACLIDALSVIDHLLGVG